MPYAQVTAPKNGRKEVISVTTPDRFNVRNIPAVRLYVAQMLPWGRPPGTCYTVSMSLNDTPCPQLDDSFDEARAVTEETSMESSTTCDTPYDFHDWVQKYCLH